MHRHAGRQHSTAHKSASVRYYNSYSSCIVRAYDATRRKEGLRTDGQTRTASHNTQIHITTVQLIRGCDTSAHSTHIHITTVVMNLVTVMHNHMSKLDNAVTVRWLGSIVVKYSLHVFGVEGSNLQATALDSVTIGN